MQLKEDENTSLLNPAGVERDLGMLLKYWKTKYSALLQHWEVKCKKCVWPIREEDDDI